MRAGASWIVFFALASGVGASGCLRVNPDFEAEPNPDLELADATGGERPRGDLLPRRDIRDEDGRPRRDLLSWRDLLAPNDMDGDGIPNEHDPDPALKNVVLYYRTLGGSAATDFEWQGEWKETGTSLCHSPASYPFHLARLKSLAASTYKVETQLDVSKILAGGSSPRVGLALRATLTPKSAYLCLIDLRDHALQISNIVNDVLSVQKATPAGTVPAAGPWKLQASIQGSAITCKLLPAGPTLSATHGLLVTGTPGFFVTKAEACFDYLAVVSP